MAASTAPVLTGGAKAKLSDAVFGLERNDRRQGTHATKTRGMVAGGRSKPWRQKGTGRARAGTTRAPHWTGGGVVFGPQPRSYTGKVNRKARIKALRIALSAHAGAGTLHVADGGSFDAPATKRAAELATKAGLSVPLVVVVGEGEENMERSFRNLQRTHVVSVGGIDVADVVWAHSIVISKTALQVLEGGDGS